MHEHNIIFLGGGVYAEGGVFAGVYGNYCFITINSFSLNS